VLSADLLYIESDGLYTFCVKVGKIKQVTMVLAAVLSLMASAVAACACSHHQVSAAPVEISCHDASHETSQPQNDVDQPSPGDQVETGCNCFVQERSPSLSSKARIPNDSSSEAPVDQQVLELRQVLVAEPAATANYSPPITYYDLLRGTRAPARAPPRL
jgi:hypothetical protein